MDSAPSYRAYSVRVSPLRRTLRRVEALARLARPINLLLIGMTSLNAQLLLWKGNPGLSLNWNLWFVMVLSTLLTAAGGYWLNDLYDQPIDRINRPTRALWTARAGQRLLFTATFLSWLIAAGLSLLLPLKIALLHVAAMVTLGWYARFGKRTGLLGNTVIALLTGIVPWEVILLSGNTTYSVAWMIPLAAGFNFVREIVKDAEDLRGDQTYGVRSLPARLSHTTWQRFLQGLWIALIGLTLMPAMGHVFLWKTLPLFYLTMCLPTVILPLLWGLTEWGDYRFMSLLLKLAMAGGLTALWGL
ncbi:MAG: UbiA family prenyltransferase [Bacteroidia bacterium]